MLKIYRLFILLFILSLSAGVSGQINTHSPYSRFGLGDIGSQGTGFSKAMGGTGIGMRLPNQLNFLNPAAYTSQDTLSFIFDIGISLNQRKYETSEKAMKKNNGAFNHLGFSFPITKWLFGAFGTSPYSSVGYNIQTTGSYIAGLGQINNRSNGSGDLNRFFLGTGVKIKNLSLGVNAYYLLGTLEYKNFVVPEDINSFIFESDNKFTVKDVLFGFGAQYAINLNNKTNLVLGATLETKSNLRAVQNKMETQFRLDDHSDLNIGHVAEDTITFPEEIDTKIGLPAKLGLGASVTFNKKLIVALDYSTQNWSKFTIDNGTQSNSSVMFSKSNSYHFGIQYQPNPMAIRGYLPHVSYRFGVRYEDTYLTINDQKIKDYGLSIGVGLPFKGSKTILNINYEIGRRGTLDKNLILEKYQAISISLSLYDFWFVKPKFD
jgi:long-subunit fatty acid transport protein